jgi:CYTH domain-containing protein
MNNYCAPREIERKFLVDRIPDAVQVARNAEIVQGYLTSESQGAEVRLRRKGRKFYATVKSVGSLTRAEYEIELTEAQFDVLWPATEGRRVEKTRYELDHRDLVIEVDIYRGQLAGLVTAEVEFAQVEQSEAFAPPDWLGTEITEDARYKNKNLALHGLPE